MFIDTHAHIYVEEFTEDRDDVIKEAYNQGVEKIFMPNIDANSIHDMLDVANNHPFCYPMMGLHPCSVKENYQDELKIVERYLSVQKFYGVGEIGIDLYWDKTYADEQIVAYKAQIQLAKDGGLPIIIHSRDSLDLTIGIVEGLQDGSLTGIYHCFNGTMEQAKKIMDLGFYMGIGGVLTYKNAGVDKVVAEIPVEYIVLETDAPYLSPVPYRGKRNQPGYIPIIANKLAEVKNVDVEVVASITTANAKKVFKIA